MTWSGNFRDHYSAINDQNFLTPSQSGKRERKKNLGKDFLTILWTLLTIAVASFPPSETGELAQRAIRKNAGRPGELNGVTFRIKASRSLLVVRKGESDRIECLRTSTEGEVVSILGKGPFTFQFRSSFTFPVGGGIFSSFSLIS